MGDGEYDLDPPLHVYLPKWYTDRFGSPRERLPGHICWHHEEVCDDVEHNMLLLRRQYHPLTAEEVEKEEEEFQNKLMHEAQIRCEKMDDYWAKKIEEDEKRECKGIKLIEDGNFGQFDDDDDEEEWVESELSEYDKMMKAAWDEWRATHDTIDYRDWQFGVKDEVFDLSLLIPKLINSNGNEINVCALSGKYVILFFWSLPGVGHAPYVPSPELTVELTTLYNVHRKDLEIVFIALGDDTVAFDRTFPQMPWLAIPHAEQAARDYFKTKFAIPQLIFGRAVLVGSDGKVVSQDPLSSILTYGVDAFPYTDGRISQFLFECGAVRRKLFVDQEMPSLTELLGENVISMDGTQVAVSGLECKKKIMGLFFLVPTSDGDKKINKLLEVWNSLNAYQRDVFMVVLVNNVAFNLLTCLERMKSRLSGIPWFSIENCGRKIGQIFRKDFTRHPDNSGDLIVLKPGTREPVSYFAFHIMAEFGAVAYPFTLHSAVEYKKSEQQSKLLLGELLSPGAPLQRGNGASYKDVGDITVSELSGKHVLLLFATYSCYEAGKFMSKLKELYESRTIEDNFEIIYMSLDCDEHPSFPKSVQVMPWLLHAFDPDFTLMLAKKVFGMRPRFPAIAAFGPGGNLQTKESYLAFKESGDPKYPFISANMHEEVKNELIFEYKWDLGSIVSSDCFL